MQFLVRHKHILLYGVSLAILLFLLKWLELRFIIVNHAFEIYIGCIALIFTALGIWLALRLIRPKIQTVVVEKEVYVTVVAEHTAQPQTNSFVLNDKELNALHISKRELEVLQLMATGLSNQEIAAQLFVSLNTIKTHTANLFVKMDVKRRTQAVEKAKRSGLIP